jgi:nicotinamidase-related amidase
VSLQSAAAACPAQVVTALVTAVKAAARAAAFHALLADWLFPDCIEVSLSECAKDSFFSRVQHERSEKCAALPAGEIVVDKPGKGAFYATNLGEILRLRGVSHLVFAGVTTEVCVQTTMREANDRGYECLLVEDATESYFPQFKAATLEMIRAQGTIVGWTATGDAVLGALRPSTARPADW